MTEINHPVLKASAAMGAFISLTWIDWLTTGGKVAAAMTAIFIFCELAWKKVLRPLSRRLGWIKPRTIYMEDD